MNIKRRGGITDFQVTKEVVGEIAQVNAQITYGDGTSKSDTSKLVKEDGRWRIDINK